MRQCEEASGEGGGSEGAPPGRHCPRPWPEVSPDSSDDDELLKERPPKVDQDFARSETTLTGDRVYGPERQGGDKKQDETAGEEVVDSQAELGECDAVPPRAPDDGERRAEPEHRLQQA